MLIRNIEHILTHFEYGEAFRLYAAHTPDCYTKRLLAEGESTFNTHKLRKELEKLALESPTVTTPGHQEADYYPDAPEEVESLLKEKRTLYKEALHTKAIVLEVQDLERRKALGEQIMRQWERIAELWESIDYWKEHGKLPMPPAPPPPAPQMDFNGLSMRKLVKLEENCRIYIQRFKNDPSKAEQVAERQAKMEEIGKVIDNVFV